jgi:hypothetical protein
MDRYQRPVVRVQLALPVFKAILNRVALWQTRWLIIWPMHGRTFRIANPKPNQ